MRRALDRGAAPGFSPRVVLDRDRWSSPELCALGLACLLLGNLLLELTAHLVLWGECHLGSIDDGDGAESLALQWRQEDVGAVIVPRRVLICQLGAVLRARSRLIGFDEPVDGGPASGGNR